MLKAVELRLCALPNCVKESDAGMNNPRDAKCAKCRHLGVASTRLRERLQASVSVNQPLTWPGAAGTEAERGSVTRSMFGCEQGFGRSQTCFVCEAAAAHRAALRKNCAPCANFEAQ